MSSPLVCLYHMRGSCRYGNRCRRSHDQGSVRTERPYNMDEEFYRMTVSPSNSASRPRQRNQVLPSSAKRSSETNETASSASKEKWTLKNNDTGEIIAGSSDSVLVETVKKLNAADNLVTSLTRKLPGKNDGDNFSWVEHQMKECLESDLQCSICYEMFIKPVVLNCSHTFCNKCIESWIQNVNVCPTCRVFVTNKTYCLHLDSFLDNIADCLPEEIKTRRETLKVERNNNTGKEVNRNRRSYARTRNNRNQSSVTRLTSDVVQGIRNRYPAQWNIALEETFPILL